MVGIVIVFGEVLFVYYVDDVDVCIYVFFLCGRVFLSLVGMLWCCVRWRSYLLVDGSVLVVLVGCDSMGFVIEVICLDMLFGQVWFD